MSDLQEMTLGQVVDFVIDYNDREKRAEAKREREEKRGKRRRATQGDIDSFFG